MPPQFEGRLSPARGIPEPAGRRACRKASPIGESCVVNVAAGLVGLAVGIVVGPVADRLATNAPRHDPLLGAVPRSPRLRLVPPPPASLRGGGGLCLRLFHLRGSAQ